MNLTLAMILAEPCIVGTGLAVCQVTWSMFRAGRTVESVTLQVAGWLCRVGNVDISPPSVMLGN